MWIFNSTNFSRDVLVSVGSDVTSDTQADVEEQINQLGLAWRCSQIGKDCSYECQSLGVDDSLLQSQHWV